jgi:nucleoside phosphorylase
VNQPSPTLICFAVKEEAKFLGPTPLRVLITGIGRANAARSLRRTLDSTRPELVLTCGFAGGLNPEIPFGAIVFDEDFAAGLSARLLELGAVPAKFYCAKRVAVTAAEKRALWESTGADAVEMESSVIRTICREYRIPSATIRVISDAADDDLPLDFNALMTSNDRINYAKLIWSLFSSPQKIPQLMKFQEQTVEAARKLDEALKGLLGIRRRP